MRQNEPKQESNQATLARVKKEMDEPRMAESAREEDSQSDARGRNRKSSVIQRSKESQAVRAQGAAPEEEINGKADQSSS